MLRRVIIVLHREGEGAREKRAGSVEVGDCGKSLWWWWRWRWR